MNSQNRQRADIEFTNLTGGNEIGANSYLLRLGEQQVLIDCGMHPRQEGAAALPRLERLHGQSLDAMFISHSHLDHIGCLPLAQRRHPDTPVFLTEPAAMLTDVMLHNSVNVMTRQREEIGQSDYPLFTHREADRCQQQWFPCRLGQGYDFQGEPTDSNGTTGFELFDAGHILGSVGILFRHKERKIFYSGDVNFEDQTLTPGARFPEEKLDTLIVETTRGEYQRPADFQRRNEEARLAAVIRETLQGGGSVFIPVFALGKSQEVLTMLHRFRRSGMIKNAPIFIGGLSTKVTTLYDRLAGHSARLEPGLRLLDALGPEVVTGDRARGLPIRNGAIYALSSGMMTENTLSHLVADKILPEKRHALLFVGYCDPASPAGRLRTAAPGDEVMLSEKGRPVKFNCRMEVFDFSAHAPREALMDYAERTAPDTLLLVHGDQPALQWFQSEAQRRLPATKVLIPPPGDPLDLD